MNPIVFALSGFIFAVGNTQWCYGRSPRLAAFCEALSAFLLAVAVPAWAAVLAGVTQTTTELGILAALTALFALGMYHEAVYRFREPRPSKNGVIRARKKSKEQTAEHYHPVRTMMFAFAFGTCAFVFYARIPELLKLGAKSPGATLKALHRTSAAFQSGDISRHIAPGSATHWLIFAGMAFVVVLIIRARIRHVRLLPRKRKPVAGGTGRGALPSRGSGALPSRGN